jgi:UDP-glucuronate decarboxylase
LAAVHQSNGAVESAAANKDKVNENTEATSQELALPAASDEKEFVPINSITGKPYGKVLKLNSAERKRIIITGGSGFVGSHLTDVLMAQGHEVTVIDNFFTGRKKNIEHWIGHPNFDLVVHDVVEPIMLEVDEIYHLASPASPPHYMYNPIKTIKTNSIGTINMLGLAQRVGARVLLASTSEVYGDPEVHPQVETYRGNVNPIGPRACYDEGKRIAETLMYAYHKQGDVEVRVARIFNTFGPRMNMGDGRVVSNFLIQALQNKDITVYGEGDQTRSFQYVSDLVAGLVALMNGNYSLPVNIGNPDEYTMLEFAKTIIEQTGSTSKIIFKPLPKDDPMRRKPDITRAREKIGWSPKISVKQGLANSIPYFANELKESKIGTANEGHVRKAGPYAHMEEYIKNSQADP